MNPQDLKDLKQLVEFLKEHQVAEFDLDRGDLKIRLKFAGASSPPAATEAAHVIALTPVVAAPAAVAPVHAAPAPQPPVEAAPPAAGPDAALHIVKSPIVGTFYSSPSPGAPSFVSIGDHVEKGQVICIIEAMKLMNEIESDATGEIVKSFVTNGQAIEYGQPLFAIKA
jgi:acetyl-CoA carboxylase biotin carboxyl carrier protein